LNFEVGLRVCDIVVKKLTFAISSPDEFLYTFMSNYIDISRNRKMNYTTEIYNLHDWNYNMRI